MKHWREYVIIALILICNVRIPKGKECHIKRGDWVRNPLCDKSGLVLCVWSQQLFFSDEWQVEVYNPTGFNWHWDTIMVEKIDAPR